jgi:hypothetical protein
VTCVTVGWEHSKTGEVRNTHIILMQKVHEKRLARKPGRYWEGGGDNGIAREES